MIAAVSRACASVIVVAKLFQLFQPMGGRGAITPAAASPAAVVRGAAAAVFVVASAATPAAVAPTSACRRFIRVMVTFYALPCNPVLPS
ncbi:hypothetical protein GCM10022253_24430 [Sphingomonas endophytica]